MPADRTECITEQESSSNTQVAVCVCTHVSVFLCLCVCVCVLSRVVIVMQMREKLKGVMGAEMEKEILIHMLYRRFYVCAYLSFYACAQVPLGKGQTTFTSLKA